MKKYMKWILLVVVLAGSAGAYGLYLYNKPVESTSDRGADIELTAEELFSHYEADETNANELYLDKVIRVSGKVLDLQDEEDGTTAVLLQAGESIFGVNCRFENNPEGITSGQDVIIKGVCSGMLSDVVLIRCVLEE